MKRSNIAVLVSIVVLFAMACGSMNRVTPKQWDDAAIEADVRGKIAESVPSKALGISVKVDHRVVTLSGKAKTADDRRKIAEAAQSVNGVKTVINNITVEP